MLRYIAPLVLGLAGCSLYTGQGTPGVIDANGDDDAHFVPDSTLLGGYQLVSDRTVAADFFARAAVVSETATCGSRTRISRAGTTTTSPSRSSIGTR